MYFCIIFVAKRNLSRFTLRKLLIHMFDLKWHLCAKTAAIRFDDTLAKPLASRRNIYSKVEKRLKKSRLISSPHSVDLYLWILIVILLDRTYIVLVFLLRWGLIGSLYLCVVLQPISVRPGKRCRSTSLLSQPHPSGLFHIRTSMAKIRRLHTFCLTNKILRRLVSSYVGHEMLYQKSW